MVLLSLARRIAYIASEACLFVIRCVVSAVVYTVIAVCMLGQALYRALVGTDE
jgi:hypothetical protein